MASGDWIVPGQSYYAPSWTSTIATSSTTAMPFYSSGVTFSPVQDISFNPNPPKPAKPATDMEWLRRQVEDVCALGRRK